LNVRYETLFQRAKEICNLNNITDMKLSSGWLQKFLKRNKIVKRRATKIAQKDPSTLTSLISEFRSTIDELR